MHHPTAFEKLEDVIVVLGERFGNGVKPGMSMPEATMQYLVTRAYNFYCTKLKLLL